VREDMIEVIEQIIAAVWLQFHADPHSGSQGDQSRISETLGQSHIAAQYRGQQTCRIEVIASKEAYFIEAWGQHLLGLIDEEHGSKKSALDMIFPAFSQGLETAVTIRRREVHPEQGPHFAIKVAEVALGDSNSRLHP